MLSLYKRLVLGCVLLVALVTGLGLLVRTSFVALSRLDGRQQAADVALSATAAFQSAISRERVAAERLAMAADAVQVQEFEARAREAEARLKSADAALERLGQGTLLAPAAEGHRQLVARVARAAHTPEQWQALAATELRPRLDSIDLDAANGLRELVLLRARELEQLDEARQALRARLIAASGASIATAIALCSALIFFVVQPLRSVAATAVRMGQGDPQARIEWRSRDHLGIIAAEMNRMAVRLRDLRETESGRRQMEQQLSDAVVQSIFEPVIVTDAKGHVLKLNQAASELLGMSSGDRMALTNTPGGDRILSAVRNAVSMQRAMAGEGEAALLPMRIGRAERSYRLRTSPIRDHDGKLLGAVTVLEDVTELRDLDRFKTRFLSIASQKLRDPLERLRLSLYALHRGHAGDLKPLQLDLVAGAQQEAERLDDLMVDLIEVGELETGRREMRMERLRPHAVIEEAVHRHREEAARRGVGLETRAFADLSPVLADRRAMRSILDNLVQNAIRYTPQGGRVELAATESKERVQFLVRDTGRGIEAERLPGIFGRFNESSGDGTGLGLALVRRLVESLSGQVAVESRLGTGTTFSFTLPVASVEDSRRPVEVG